MNLFYTGLGIARSLGDAGIPVIGLTARRSAYGNFTRHAKTVLLSGLPGRTGSAAHIFDRDGPGTGQPQRNLPDARRRFGVSGPVPIGAGAIFQPGDAGKRRFARVPGQMGNFAERAASRCGGAAQLEDRDNRGFKACNPGGRLPLYTKTPIGPLFGGKGATGRWLGPGRRLSLARRKSCFASTNSLPAPTPRAIVQEMVEGGDDHLLITACYMDRSSRCLGAFYAQKLVQIPEGFGTGCIVRSVDRPELLEPTIRLLQSIGFSGVAEVEYKWDSATGEYKLIEVNPRPWDQHRLGKACGVDLIYMAYCDHAGLAMPPATKASFRATSGSRTTPFSLPLSECSGASIQKRGPCCGRRAASEFLLFGPSPIHSP